MIRMVLGSVTLVSRYYSLEIGDSSELYKRK